MNTFDLVFFCYSVGDVAPFSQLWWIWLEERKFLQRKMENCFGNKTWTSLSLYFVTVVASFCLVLVDLAGGEEIPPEKMDIIGRQNLDLFVPVLFHPLPSGG